MRLAAATIATFSAQLMLGGLLYGCVARLLARRGAGGGGLRRRWIVAWNGAALALWHLAPYAATTLVLGLILAARTSAGLSGALDAIWFRAAWFVMLGAAPTSACWLLVQAGRLEARGRPRAARVRARLAGELVFVGTSALLVFVWSHVIFHVPIRRALVESTEGAGLLLLGGTVSAGCGAFIALLAGLASKPRPSGWLATLFYTSGLTALIASHQIATP